MKKIAAAFILFGSVFVANAEELDEGNTYRARTEMLVGTDGSNFNLKVGAHSKFVVIDNDDEKNYAIRFTVIYPRTELKPGATFSNKESDYLEKKLSEVTTNTLYFVAKKNSLDVPLENKVEEALGGIVSGPLIVPFKYRLDDKSLDGSATIGLFAGWGYDVPLLGKYVTITPMIAGGVTQISFESTSEAGDTSTETKSGFSLAAGLLIRNWDSLNIGIVFGQDRIGDKDYSHEGENWLSFSVGWDLTK